ncbi:uncharacterized protein LOC125224969 [Leguminivora glycinivorella]|uniref:uncharacterized protein LOC125224969 n=1 Tax=Leguminivora glycinivorella TaxID=1035111 RepID=UPI00200E9F6F|nr:uncharacterized protein LOC125224969 [Leguminivora glycinivorella]
MTSLMSRWSGLSTEQLAIATIMSHVAQFEPRAQRIAFTTNFTSRNDMQRELKAVAYLKRCNNETSDDETEPESKRFKPRAPLKCYNCDKTGHRAAACRIKKDGIKDSGATASSSSNSTKTSGTAKSSSTLTCYKCGQPGHIASRCVSSGSKDGSASSSATTERRVDMCSIEEPFGI